MKRVYAICLLVSFLLAICLFVLQVKENGDLQTQLDQKSELVAATSNELTRCGLQREKDRHDRIELDRLMLKSAYDMALDDFDASHLNMGGGRISYA